MCCNHHHYSPCYCCGHTCCPTPYHWVQQPSLWYYTPAPFVVQAPPVEKKIDRILELAERAEKRAKLNKKKSDRW
jgi:hypothetical protein